MSHAFASMEEIGSFPLLCSFKFDPYWSIDKAGPISLEIEICFSEDEEISKYGIENSKIKFRREIRI